MFPIFTFFTLSHDSQAKYCELDTFLPKIMETEETDLEEQALTRYLVKRLCAPDSLAWKAQKILLQSLDKVINNIVLPSMYNYAS